MIFMKQVFAILLIFAVVKSNAALIDVGFSGTIETNSFDVPVGTIVSGSFTFDTNATSFLFGLRTVFIAESASISMFGETATINSGYNRVDADSMEFSA